MKLFNLITLLNNNCTKFLFLIVFCIQVQNSYSQKGEKESIYLQNKLEQIDSLIETNDFEDSDTQKTTVFDISADNLGGALILSFYF